MNLIPQALTPSLCDEDLSESEQQDILHLQQEILAAVAQNLDHLTVIRQVCLLEEQLLPDAVASVMLLDEQKLLQLYVAPSIPAEAAARLRSLRPGPHAGSCGNAVYRGEAVFVSNTRSDPRWQELRPLALDFGLMACWSMPIRGAGQQVLGTFALSSFVGREPGAFHRKILEIGASIIGIVLERQRQEQTLSLLGKVFESSNQAIMLTDSQAGILEVNRAFSDMTGYSAAEVKGRRPSLLSSGRHDRAFYQNMWRSLQERGYWQGEVWNRRKNGEVYPEWLSITAIREAGQITNYVSFFFDISEQKATQARLEFLTCHDPLTELPNRLIVQEQLSQAMVSSARRQLQAALLYLDLDEFRTINASLGQAVGDQLLRAVGERLRQLLGEQYPLGRLDSDEFAIVLAGVEELDQPAELAEQIIQAFLKPFVIAGHELICTLSIGIALYPEDGEDGDSLLKKADSAMSHAKQDGRNTFRFYSESMNRDAAAHLQLRTGLRRALAQGELFLEYQPQVELVSGRVIGAEALVRWQHPQLGRIAPADFIGVAEQSGLIVPLGEWVLQQACVQAAAWQRAGHPLVVAVNLSGVQFKRGDLVDSVAAALLEYELDPALLELELTETILIEGTEHVLDNLQRLKALGVQLSIDDFGTGYSSLAYLSRLPVDKLKIDQSFVRSLRQVPANATIVRMVVQMARSLGIRSIAEGVEDAQARDFLLANQCDEGQGYWFSRPLAAASLSALLEAGGGHLPPLA